MRPLLAAAFSLSLACPSAAKTLVLTHPETEYDQKSAGGPRAQELLSSREFRERLVLTVYKDRSHYTFDPDGRGVSFRRVISTGGQLEEDLGDDEFVVGGGFISACMQDTVTDLLHHSNARRVRLDLAAIYAHVPMSYFPGATSTAPKNMAEFERAAPGPARVYALRIAERVYGALRRRGLGDRSLEVRWHGRTLGVIDHTTYSDATPDDFETAPRLRGSGGRPAHAVIEFE